VRCGLRGIKLVISDAMRAESGDPPGVRRRLATLPFTSDAQRSRPCHQNPAERGGRPLRQAFLQPDRAQASAMLRHVADQLRPKWTKLAGFIDDSESDVLSYLDFPGPAPHQIAQHG
jgi:putative transposase